METEKAFRVQPRVWIGVAIFLGYVAVVFTVQALSGIPYTELDASGANLFFGAGLSLVISAILLAITTTLLGWWRPALFDRHRAGHKWPIIAPAIMVVGLVMNLVATDWGSYDGAFFAASIVLLLVGFTEELTTRGLLLTGLRSRLSEVWVWLITSVLFGAMHFINVLTGQPVGPTIQQVVLAFGAGTIFYVLRRVTGSLIWAMILHGFWDFSTFAVSQGTPASFAGFSGILEILAIIVALVSVPFVVRGADERLDTGLSTRRPVSA
ncbi:type II CAAX endopeptidase family protein [Microbacterium sp. ET2]|uniref:CPBP family intramembrane glutamic endopeptidase n=1 Tax=Microbacterium albipurpureum TaxID=3050384 RepID=UPI00259CAD92|nr:type II CAAX endopeptidase family protein [Microbacterium sp. ET2 (Ac-2212)]WJL96947.1 type II CAAX endopeptidase family protein [Microbacterium sp. ET2 (Ac-2212)]